MNLPSKLVNVLTMSTLIVALLGGLTSAGAEEMPECIKEWTHWLSFVRAAVLRGSMVPT